MFIPKVKSRINEDISILINLENHSPGYLCECGEASELTVKECQNIECIFISHTHIDHFINFDQLLRHQIGLKKRIVICGPAGIVDQVQSKIKGYSWNLIEPGAIIYEVREVIDENRVNVYELDPPKWEVKKIGQISGGEIYDAGKFSVRYTILDHKIPSLAFLFKEIDSIKIDLSKSAYKGGAWVAKLKQAFETDNGMEAIDINGETFPAKDLFHLLSIKRGNSVGVIMDHAASKSNHDKIKGLFTGCDKVFIESFYQESDKESAETNYHSYSSESGRIMRECGVKEAIPVHFSRKYKQADVEILMKEFEAAFRG